MVWDTGTYDSTNDNIPPEQQLARGKIDIDLHGTKLRGGFSLVRTGKSSRQSTVRERWLLIKHRDELISAYSSGWSSVRMARCLSAGFMEGPLGPPGGKFRSVRSPVAGQPSMPTHSRQTVSSADIITGPRNSPISPNVCRPPMIPTSINRKGSRVVPPINAG